MRKTAISLLASLLAAVPAAFLAAPGEPAGLPDLAVKDIILDVGGVETYGAPARTGMVNITVFVNNKDLDNLTSVFVTVFVNGTLLGVAPAAVPPFAGPGFLAASLAWDTASLPAGVYEVRAQANDSAGDLHPEDNAAGVPFTFSTRPPGLRLGLDRTVVQTTASGITSRLVLLTGNITASDLNGQFLDVRVTSATDAGWVTAASPSKKLFVEDGAINFTASVVIPAGWRAGSGLLNVTARARAIGLDLNATAAATVTVKPYFEAELSTRQPTIQIETGGSCTFTVTLRNDGNTNDSFPLEIANFGDLEAKDAAVFLSCRTLANVGPGETGTFKVNFRGPQDWTIWKQDSTLVLIGAISLGARSENRTVSRSLPVYACETGAFPPWINTLFIITMVLGVGMTLAIGILALLAFRKSRHLPAGKGPADGGPEDKEPKPLDSDDVNIIFRGRMRETGR